MWAQLLLGAFFLQVSVSSGLHPCTLPVHQRGRGPEHYYHHDQLLTKIKAIEVKDEHGIDGLDDENYELLQEASGAWMERARQLLAFKRVNGHTRVPKRFKENPALGNWVNKQRQQYRNYLTGTKPCSLTESRIELLNQLGFCWDASPSNLRSSETSHESSWMMSIENDLEEEWWDSLNQLRRLADQLQVPHAFIRSVPRLSHSGRWLQRQRQIYQRQQQQRRQENDTQQDDDHYHHQTKECYLSDKQIQALVELDPDWWMTHRQWQWEIRYRELQEYAASHGDCCVPISHTNRKLAHFVSNQRKQYNLKKQGKPSNLREDRQERLNAIGFVWNRWEYEFSRKQEMWEE